jgi:hypothetical protein
VPGSPAAWTPPGLPIQLQEDFGLHYVDQHGFRVPCYQFEPLFQACAIMNRKKRFDNIDVVINRSSIRKLLTFASGERDYSAFHMDVDLIDNTLFLGRRERYAKAVSRDSCDRTFEATFTAADSNLPGADGHHRVI